MQQANAEVEAQTAALQQANRIVQQLEAAIPKASLEAEAQHARARDLQQRLSSLEEATQVTLQRGCHPILGSAVLNHLQSTALPRQQAFVAAAT